MYMFNQNLRIKIIYICIDIYKYNIHLKRKNISHSNISSHNVSINMNINITFKINMNQRANQIMWGPHSSGIPHGSQLVLLLVHICSSSLLNSRESSRGWPKALKPAPASETPNNLFVPCWNRLTSGLSSP